jgi:hypothetical protein
MSNGAFPLGSVASGCGRTSPKFCRYWACSDDVLKRRTNDAANVEENIRLFIFIF